MIDETPSPPASLDHRTRLLLPFFFDRNAVCKAGLLLSTSVQIATGYRDTEKKWPCWDKPDKVPTLYRDEILPSVHAFLFNRADGCCGYLKVPDQTANFWFKKGGIVAKQHGKASLTDRPAEFPVSLAEPGIELFLSPHGAGVLSVAFEPREKGDQRYLQEFNYRLSQARSFTAFHFRLPHDENFDPNPPPATDALLAERLGKAGGAFTLLEWAEFLLEPLQTLNYRRVQEQFSVYSVTRFDAAAVFTEPGIQTRLRTHLAAMAHVEEYHHAGSLAVTEQLLNPRHWVAVGSLGAAHLVADQGQSLGFDEQRLPLCFHKYFVPYLLALLQRTTLLHMLDDTRIAITDLVAVNGKTQAETALLYERINFLNAQTLAFTVNGYFTEISVREVHNQYYSLAQAGLRVQVSFRTLQQALHDAEVMNNDRFQSSAIDNLKSIVGEANVSAQKVAEVQTKLEWLEVFFVSYYATALVHYIGESEFFNHAYIGVSLVIAPLLSGLIAFQGLKPQQMNQPAGSAVAAEAEPGTNHQLAREAHSDRRSRFFLYALVSVFLVWGGIGWFWFPNNNAEKPSHGAAINIASPPTPTEVPHPISNPSEPSADSPIKNGESHRP